MHEFRSAGAEWRTPEPGLLARQHEAFGQLLADLGCEVEVIPARSTCRTSCH